MPLKGMTKNRDFTEEQAKFAFSCADVNEDDKIDISEFVQLFFPSAKEVGNSLQNVWLELYIIGLFDRPLLT